jgi:molecular chaperone GrpE (heat shock protein)
MNQSQDSDKQEALEDSFNARTEELEKKMSRVKKMAGKNDAKQPSDHVEASLHQLTQQVSAIREYASNQQERVKKLQDGYDWNIIKNFCLRVIRCIDNLDSRMERLSTNKVDTSDLEEVRDELVFALESTGVEQFEPELKSDYRGQEKNTEAVKEKQSCKEKKMAGKIAKVIRVGYQYAIDEDNFKVVRAAQVKLFG